MLVLLIIFMVAAPLPPSICRSTCRPRRPFRRRSRTSRPTSASSRISRLRSARPRSSAPTWSRRWTHGRAGQGPVHLPARRPRRRLWRSDGCDGAAAHRRLLNGSSWWRWKACPRAAAGAGRSRAASPDGRTEMSNDETRAESLRGGCGLAAVGGAGAALGGAALAVAHLQGTDEADGARRQRRRDRLRDGVARSPSDRAAARTGDRCVDGLAAACRAEGGGEGNRAAEGQAERDRGLPTAS